MYRFAAFTALLLTIGFSSGPALAASASDASTNWSGYIADTAAYSGVGASWVVPAPANTGTLASDATWVGIGGEKSADLIQAGTQAVIRGGVTTYEAWYELLPAGQVAIPLAVKGGDAVHVSLQETASSSWHLSFIDTTTGGDYETDLAYASSLSSAEWIEEAPLAVRGQRSALLPLDAFGSVTFTGGFAIANGTRATIAETGASPIEMARGPLVLATPSTLSGDSFSIMRADTLAAPPGAAPSYALTRYTDRPFRRHLLIRMIRFGR